MSIPRTPNSLLILKKRRNFPVNCAGFHSVSSIGLPIIPVAPMKSVRLFVCLLLCALTSSGADTPVEINLLDGSHIKGRVMSATVSEITFMSDFGVSRIPLEMLTPESRALASQASKPDVDALLRRVAELEAKVSQLQQENESLRRQAIASPTPAYRPPSGASSLTPSSGGTTTTPAAGVAYTISSTGKRHNSGCRFFSGGRSCSPTDGIACKICGG
jgi:hypothetical protein